jgi:hypothetical protein
VRSRATLPQPSKPGWPNRASRPLREQKLANLPVSLPICRVRLRPRPRVPSAKIQPQRLHAPE